MNDYLFEPLFDIEQFVNRFFDKKLSMPVNYVKEEDGSLTVEMAVVGKTKDDIEVTAEVTPTKSVLYIKSKDVAKDSEKRDVVVRKIKFSGSFNVEIPIPTNYDIENAAVEVENGLLTVTIPVKQVQKNKITFDIK